MNTNNKKQMKKALPKGIKKTFLLNAGFGVLCLSVLIFLYLAPEETTTRLPQDDIHQEFHHIVSKKEAEKSCTTCHGDELEAPLPEDHPPPYRCLFCHKRDQ